MERQGRGHGGLVRFRRWISNYRETGNSSFWLYFALTSRLMVDGVLRETSGTFTGIETGGG